MNTLKNPIKKRINPHTDLVYTSGAASLFIYGVLLAIISTDWIPFVHLPDQLVNFFNSWSLFILGVYFLVCIPLAIVYLISLMTWLYSLPPAKNTLKRLDRYSWKFYAIFFLILIGLESLERPFFGLFIFIFHTVLAFNILKEFQNNMFTLLSKVLFSLSSVALFLPQFFPQADSITNSFFYVVSVQFGLILSSLVFAYGVSKTKGYLEFSTR